MMDELSIIREYCALKGVHGNMIDVGVLAGGHLQPFLAAGWSVHAFEPNPAMHERLAALEKKFPALHVNPLAVRDVDQTGIAFYTSPVSQGISGLSAFHESHVESARVDTIRLSTYCQSVNLSDVGILKIDTEGHDLTVLQGCDWTCPALPRVVMCEFDEAKVDGGGACFVDLTQFLSVRGYALLVSEWAPIAEYGQEHQWLHFSAFPSAPSSEKAWGNIVAFRDELDWAAWATACTRVLRTEKAKLDKRLAARIKDHEHALAMVRSLEEDLRFQQGSRSWRWSKPIRMLESLLRKGR